MKESDLIELFDTTLRDGTQGERVNLSIHDKLLITEKLDDFGIDIIEGVVGRAVILKMKNIFEKSEVSI